MEFPVKSSIHKAITYIAVVMLFTSVPIFAQNASVSSTVLPVKNTEAPALASRLQSVLQDFGISAQVTADRTTNSLIVNGSSNAHKIAADLLRTLDLSLIHI